MVINTIENRQEWGERGWGGLQFLIGRSGRVLLRRDLKEVFLSLIHVLLADCVRNCVRHCGGSPGNIPIL